MIGSARRPPHDRPPAAGLMFVTLVAIFAPDAAIARQPEAPALIRVADHALVRAACEQARLAKEPALTVEALLAPIRPAYSTRETDFLRAHADAVVPALCAAAGSEEPAQAETARNAVRALLALDAPEAGRIVAARLGGDGADDAIREGLLWELKLAVLRREPPPGLATPELIARLRSVAQAGQPKALRLSALTILARLDPARTVPLLESALDDPDLDAIVVFNMLTAAAPTPDRVEWIRDRATPPTLPVFRGAMLRLLWSGTEDVQRATAQLALELVEGGGWDRNTVFAMRDTPQGPRAALAVALDPRRAAETRVEAARELIYVPPASVVDALEPLLDDPVTRRAGLDVASRLDGVAPRPELLTRFASYWDGADRDERRDIASAIVRLGGERGKDLLRRLYATPPPEPDPLVHWFLNDVTVDVMFERIAGSGLAPDASEERTRAFLDRAGAGEWAGHRRWPLMAASAALEAAGAGVRFDAEDASIPPDYVRLVAQFAAGSAGQLDVDCAEVVRLNAQDEEAEPELRVRIVVADVLYEFPVRWLGDWFDTKAVQEAINFILADTGRDRRVFQLAMGQYTGYVFATPDQARMLRDELFLPFAVDPDQAVREGREYEKAVRRRLGDALNR